MHKYILIFVLIYKSILYVLLIIMNVYTVIIGNSLLYARDKTLQLCFALCIIILMKLCLTLCVGKRY